MSRRRRQSLTRCPPTAVSRINSRRTGRARSVIDALADRYTVERELGRGGMATVYLADDLQHGRKVAIKVLRPELGVAARPRPVHPRDPDRRRAQPPAHPAALRLGRGRRPVLFYVMPYVRGGSLRQRLARERQLPIDEAVGLVRQVAAALDHAHAHGLIHRDIKPENILLHEGEAMVTDFGIALAAETAPGERLTATGLMVGTPEYMSPEQAAGERDARCPERRVQPRLRALRAARRRAAVHAAATRAGGDRQAVHRAGAPGAPRPPRGAGRGGRGDRAGARPRSRPTGSRRAAAFADGARAHRPPAARPGRRRSPCFRSTI